jgi:molecular chaperone GrpE
MNIENTHPGHENDELKKEDLDKNVDNITESLDGGADNVSESTEESNKSGDTMTSDISQLVQDEKDKYLRLYSEFDNFRKRTAKDRLEWMQTASKDLIVSLLPVVDDFERALKAMDNSAENATAAKEGILLIYNKLMGILQKSGLQSVTSIGEVFDVEKHEAITQFAAPSEEMKGKVIDEVEKGYMLHDKIIRFAKVVVGN